MVGFGLHWAPLPCFARGPEVLGHGILVAPQAIFASIDLRRMSGSSVLVCVGLSGAW